ncbi:hypothetical protein [Spirosoma gilvum]
MRTSLMNNEARCLAVVCLMTCPFVSPVTVAMPQNSASVNRLMDKPGDNSTSIAGSPTSKPELAMASSPAKEQKGHDKQNLSRCWKRLMGMAREVSHAHRNSK